MRRNHPFPISTQRLPGIDHDSSSYDCECASLACCHSNHQGDASIGIHSDCIADGSCSRSANVTDFQTRMGVPLCQGTTLSPQVYGSLAQIIFAHLHKVL